MSASKAKRFVVESVLAQAHQEGVTLSDLEITMLGFAEQTANSKELTAAQEFENEVDNKAYEAKIALLLKHAYQNAKTSGTSSDWDNALAELAEADAYIIVIADLAGIRNTPFDIQQASKFLVAQIPLLSFMVAAAIVAFTPVGTRALPNVFARCAIIFLLLMTPLAFSIVSRHKGKD